MLEAIHELNMGKSSGPDGFPAGFSKSCPDVLTDLLVSVYNEGLENEALHDSFYHWVAQIHTADLKIIKIS